MIVVVQLSSLGCIFNNQLYTQQLKTIYNHTVKRPLITNYYPLTPKKNTTIITNEKQCFFFYFYHS